MSRKGVAVPLSSDQKAERPDELERVRKAGSFVIHKRVMGELAISRAIGDKNLKSEDVKAIIADPEIETGVLGKDDEFVVLACDGLYDVMSNQDIVKQVKDLRTKSITTIKKDNIKILSLQANVNAKEPMSDNVKQSADTMTDSKNAGPQPVKESALDAVCEILVTHAIDALYTRDNVSVIIVTFHR